MPWLHKIWDKVRKFYHGKDIHIYTVQKNEASWDKNWCSHSEICCGAHLCNTNFEMWIWPKLFLYAGSLPKYAFQIRRVRTLFHVIPRRLNLVQLK